MKNYTQKAIKRNIELSKEHYNYWLGEINKATFNNISNYELAPEKDKRLSFYGKARINELILTINNTTFNVKLLTSYETNICFIIHNLKTNQKDIYFNANFWTDGEQTSNTTLRHIKEFIYQELGKDNLTKTDLLKLKHLTYNK